jgi:hypothetical protein
LGQLPLRRQPGSIYELFEQVKFPPSVNVLVTVRSSKDIEEILKQSHIPGIPCGPMGLYDGLVDNKNNKL